MYDVVLTEHAEADLDEALSYIEVKLDNAEAARRLADAVGECIERLSSSPFMYACCNDARLRSMGYRKAVIRNYVMIYRVAQNCVNIMRFFHGSRDYEKLL